MRSVHCGDLQGRERLSCLHPMLSRHVLGKDSSDLRVRVQRVSRAYVLRSRERSADQLYMQRRIHGARWIRVRGVRGRGFKDVNDSSACTLCSRGTYSAKAAQISESACSVCPAHAFSGAGSIAQANCTCNKGYTGPDGSECEACTAGGFKDVNGSAACMLCTRGKYSTATAAISEATCQGCPSYTYSGPGSSVLSNCSCVVGYTGPDGMECTACIAGTYKDVNGSAPCSLCPQGKYSSGTGEAWEAACTGCPYDSYSPDGSSLLNNCSCNKGYTGSYGVCAPCAPGKFKPQSGSAACSPCAVGAFQKLPARWQACLSCVAGKFANETGSSFCRSCPPHSFSTAAGVHTERIAHVTLGTLVQTADPAQSVLPGSIKSLAHLVSTAMLASTAVLWGQHHPASVSTA